jgi:ABC-type uncharacterized transport system permease subunit
MPTTGHLALLIVATALFAAGGVASLARLRSDAPGLRRTARGCLLAGIAASIGVLAWHASSTGRWVPLGDNFDALVWLATLLAGFVLYAQRTKPLALLDAFVVPLVVLLLVAAGFFGRETYHDYVTSTWTWVHHATSYGGAVAFAVAAAAGAMYVVASRRLRAKGPAGPPLGSLERLEHLTMSAVTLGFALLTVGAITGGVMMVAGGRHTPLTKVLLASAVWLVYAVVLHAPINPSFRGRKVAVLSVVGFVLMIGTIVVVQLLPEHAT